jgi:hypothetical protein
MMARSNLRVTLRDRGKIVARRDGHNIWLDFGRTYLASLLAYQDFAPLVTEQDNRVSYIGFGIGGTRQISPAIANNEPLLSHYPGGLTQTDAQPGILKLERPVRFGWTTVLPEAPGVGGYDLGDVWLKEVQVPTHPIATSTRFAMTATSTELNGGYYLAVPLSEVGLFHRGAGVHVYNNSPIAYDTFDTVQKTGLFDLTVSWTIRF